MRKRRKKSFVAQQMLILLNQLAHNLIQWVQNWMIKALRRISSMKSSWSNWWTPSNAPTHEDSDIAVETLSSFGMKRFVRQVLCLSGEVTMRNGKVLQVSLNPLYLMISRIRTAFDALLKPYGIAVSLHEI